MAIYTSNVNRVTGLSGIDTESMIDKMMQAESLKYKRLEKDKTKVTWKQEAYRELITAMQDFQNKWLGTNPLNNIGYNAFWNNYKTSIKDSVTGADSNIITINGTSNSGKYDIEVIQKAETASITGNEISTNISTGQTAEDIKKKIEKYGDISLKFSLDGQTKEIKIKSSDISGRNLEDVFQEKLNEQFGRDRVTVEKDGGGKLVFKPVGSGHNLSIGEGSGRTEGVSFTESGALSGNEYSITIDGFTATAKFEEGDTTDQKLEKIQKALKEATKGEEKKDLSSLITISKEGENDIVIKNNSANAELTYTSSITSEGKTLFPTGSLTLMDVINSTNSISLDSKLSNVFGEKFNGLFSGVEDELNLNFGGKDVTITKDDTIQTFINRVNSSDGNVKISFNEVTNRFKVESTQSGANGNVNINDEKTKDFLKNIINIDVDNKGNNSSYVDGKDAIFKVDGIETTRPSNDVSMNGIKFTINGTGKVTIESSSDVDGTVKKVKEFIDDYNKLIEKVNDAYLENRAKSGKYEYYEPLTDDEKKAMSEDEIKKWEEQAKQGLLYKDEYLGKFMSGLRSNIYKSVDIGGKSISLYEIGITGTSDYNDGGKLQFDEEKFKKALQERGDEVRQLFTNSENGIAANIKKQVDNAIGSKGYLRKKAGIKGTTSVANNDLSKELADITKRLADERERLYNKEMQYFQMFAMMEAAMNKQNSQMGMLLGMTGTA